MGYVQEYGKGKWRARKRIDGKLTSRSFDSRTEAYAWADDDTPPTPPTSPTRTAAVSHGRIALSASTLTVDAFIAGGGYSVLNTRESTQAFTESLLRAHIIPRWGDVPMRDITHLDVQRWVTELSKKDLAPRTVCHIAKKFKSVLDAAVRSAIIDANPATGMVLPRIPDEEMRFINTDQIVALTESMHGDYKAFVPLCAFGGLRIGEALGLRWGRVDLFTGNVRIEEIVTEVKGHKILGDPKTRASRRNVSIPRVVVHALSDHQRTCGAKPGPEDFVFGGNVDPVSARSFRRWRWSPAVEAAGLTPLRPHDLRHTAVAMWIAAGASPKEVASRAGHTSVSFCLDRYGHLFPSMDQALADRLDVLIEKGIK
jgi:integrase